MISLEERKLALFIRTRLLKKELKYLQQEEQNDTRPDKRTESKVYPGFLEMVSSLDNEEE